MSRKSVFLGLGIVLLLIVVVSATLVLLVRHEPADYARLAVPEGEDRSNQSRDFFDRASKLLSEIQGEDGAGVSSWDAEFTDEQINCFLEEGFIHSGISEKLLPEGMSRPRVALDTDRLRLMFRYGTGFWSTIITIDFKLWIAGEEPNVVALEIQGFRAGSLPITAQSLLERISDGLRRNNIEVTWYRHDGNPVAILHFQSDPQRAEVQLRELKLEPGRILLQGTSRDGSGPSALLPASMRWAFSKNTTIHTVARQ
jgi:hypothetical protein